MGRPRFNPADYLGKVFGQWTVIGTSEKRYHVRVRCTCGREREITPSLLRSGKYKSCCYCDANHRPNRYGDYRKPLCVQWGYMRKKKKPEMWGPWKDDYGIFREAMFALGATLQSRLRRIDPDLPFQPGNVCLYDREKMREERLNRIAECLTMLGNPRTAEQLASLTRERRYQLLLWAVSLPGEHKLPRRRTER